MNRSRARRSPLWPALLLWLVALAAAAAPQFPELTGRVVDNAHLLDPPTAQRLSLRLAEFERDSAIQLVVVTLPDLQDYPIEEFGYQLGRHWGIGQQGKDNGVLLIVAQAERKVRIEVGYGLEGALTDALSANIIHSVILPSFRRGQFAAGIEGGADAIMQALQGEYEPKAAPTAGDNRGGAGFFLLMMMLVFVLFVGGLGGVGGGRGGRGGYVPGGFGGGGFGGGGFGGGGFGGGGGGFGGGGASGGW